MLINMVRVKIVAVILGPYGIGITSQVTTLINTLTVLLYVGMGPGVTKFLAEANARGDRQRARRVVATAALTLLGVTIAGVVVSLALSGMLAQWTLQDQRLRPLIVISIIGVPFAVYSNLGRACLQGYKRIQAIAVSNVSSTILSFLTVVPLVYFAWVQGAVINIALAWAFSATLYWFFWFRAGEWRPWQIRHFDKNVLRELIRYGAASLAVGGAIALNTLAIRSLVVSQLGADQNGIYQAVYGLSTQYMTLVTGAMATYSFAQLSELGALDQIIKEINNNFRLVLLVLTPVLATVLIFRELGLLVLYSAEFLPAAGLFPFQAIGDLLMAVAWAFGIALLPMGKVRVWLLSHLAGTLVFFGSAMILIPSVGLTGVVIAYAIGFGLQACIGGAFLWRRLGFRFSEGNAGLFVRSAVVIVTIGLIPGGALIRAMAGLLLIAGWSALALKPDEWRRAWSVVRRRITAIVKQGREGEGRQ